MSILSFERRRPVDQKTAMASVVSSRIKDEDIAGRIGRTPVVKSPAEAFHRDVQAIVQSPAYRKLSRHGMIGPASSAFLHSRQSHSQIAANIGVQIAHELGMSEASRELIRAISYAHDLGHPPFSHEGELAIAERLRGVGIVWDHDRATLDTLLNGEVHNIGFPGLPISHATLEGVAKRYWRFNHNYEPESTHLRKPSRLPPSMQNDTLKKKLHLENQWNHAEGQIACCADWIAGTVSDIEDIIMILMNEPKSQRGKRTREFLDAVKEQLPLAGVAADKVTKDLATFIQDSDTPARHSLPDRMDSRLRVMVKMFCDELQTKLVQDVVAQTKRRLKAEAGNIEFADDIRHLDALLIQPSPKVRSGLLALKQFYNDSIYTPMQQQQPTITMVETVFDDLVTRKYPMEFTWDETWQAIDTSSLDQKEKNTQKALLVTRYITSNLNDESLTALFKQHHPRKYAQMLVKSGTPIHPILPDTIDASIFPQPDAISSELKALKDNNRLAIHMWEHFVPSKLMAFRLEGIETPSNKIISVADKDPDAMPFLSMSLLPPSQTKGKSRRHVSDAITPSFRPWGVDVGTCRKCYGYLFDLSQDRTDRALVPRIEEANLASGGAIEDKDFSIDSSRTRIDAIRKALKAHPTKEALVKHACSAQGAAFTEGQLDALGDFYHNALVTPIDNVFPHNELLVGAGKEHIKAIVVVDHHSGRDPEPENSDRFTAALQLNGALLGLQHISKRKLDLPVVYYHVRGPHKGEITTLGKGKEDLTAKAIDAIKELQGDDRNKCKTHFRQELSKFMGFNPSSVDMNYRDYCDAIEKLTGINPEVSVKDQQEQGRDGAAKRSR